MADLAIAIKIATEDQSSGPISKIKGALGGLGEALSAPHRAIGGLVSGFGQLGLAAAGVGAAFDAVKGVGNAFGLGALNEMEQTRASFMAFTKDAAKTEELLAGVREEAAKTPFAFGEMAKATASLLPVAKSSGASIEDLRKQAEILAASNPMEGLEGASFSLREAMTGDFTSIIERFNLSRQTINKLKEEGVPNLEIVRRAMAEMGFDSDLIAAKAETLDGRWSTFQDTLVTLQTRMGQPIFDAMKEGLVGLQGILDANMGTFEGWADSVAAGIQQVIDLSKNLFDIFMGGDSFDAAAEVLDQFFPPEVVDPILALVSDLGGVFESVFQGDIPGAIMYAQGVIDDFGALIVGAVESWASSFAAWVDGADSGMMDGLGGMLTGLMSWLQESSYAIIEKLAVWAGAFVDWVGPKIPPLLAALGGLLSELLGWMLGTGLPRLAEKLAEWGLAFVEWVAPRIPPLLLALGGLLLELGTWIVTTALPAIVEKLLEWGAAFAAWVPGALVRLLFELGKLEVELLAWIVTTALPNIVAKLIEWGGAFLGWVAKDVLPKLPGTLNEIMLGIGKWVGEKVASVALEAAKVGAGFVQGIQDGIANTLGGFWSWLQVNFVDKIPAFVRDLLNIHSPSGVFADIGRNIVDGLRVGMESRLPSIDEVISRLVGRIATTGEVTDWLKAAMAVAGVGVDWLPGLQRLVAWESSGNPTARNPQSVAGQHATGLLQTLPSTFRGYALPGMGDILNPIHNAAAAIRYILDTYGSVYNIPGIASGNRSQFPGYATGGWAGLRGPELAWIGEREPELVIPRSRLMAASGGGGTDYERIGAELAAQLGPVIAATRPQTFIGTTDELARRVRREQDAARHRHDLLRGAGRGR